jgi:hypothetical protein
MQAVVRRDTALTRPGNGRKRVLVWAACVEDV